MNTPPLVQRWWWVTYQGRIDNMNISQTIKMCTSLFGDGDKGYAFQVSRNDEFGVELSAVRQKHGSPWVETFTCDYVPEKEFSTFAELRGVAMTVAPQQYKAVVIETKQKETGGRCWLCSGPDARHVVVAKYGWRKKDQTYISSCEKCLPKIQENPRAAIDARREFCRKTP